MNQDKRRQISEITRSPRGFSARLQTVAQELVIKDDARKLLRLNEPSLRFKILIAGLVEKPIAVELERLQAEIKSSQRVHRLLSERNADGEIPFHPYAKWYGAHWVLACLAELGYPPADQTLIPLREQVYRWLFSNLHENGIRCLAGRVRRHASQEGNAIYALLTLGLADDRTEILAERLRQWQWPDGGWNCDTRPQAA